MGVKYCSVIGVNDFGFVALGLAARSCPFTHPYDIIWHWSSCHPSPPCLLPLPSSCPPFLCSRPGTDHQKDGVSQTLSYFLAQAQTAAPCQSTGSSIFLSECFLTYHLRSQSLLFTFRVFPPFFSPHRPPPLPVCCSPCVSHSLQSIINFNLRAGLNGTLRERSMLSIWMPARLDLGIPHQGRRGKISSLFIIGTSYSHEPAHPNHWSDTWMQEV